MLLNQNRRAVKIIVDNELYEELKRRAARDGQTISNTVEDAFNEYLHPHPRRD